jgi:hypothetical protein
MGQMYSPVAGFRQLLPADLRVLLCVLNHENVKKLFTQSRTVRSIRHGPGLWAAGVNTFSSLQQHRGC